MITNVLVDRDGDRATVRANLMVTFAPLAGTPESAFAPQVQFVLGEVYHFDVVRTAGRWRFARVETVPVWMSGSRGPSPRPGSDTRSA
jgi:hypothetical protein